MIRSSLGVALPALLASAAVAQLPVLPAIPYPATLDLLVVDSTSDCVWRVSDFSQDGDYGGANEVLQFYSDVGNIPLTNPTCIVVAPNGRAYVADSTEDKIIELVDQNGDGDANDPGEFIEFFTSITNASGVIMASAQGITCDALGRLFVASSNAGTSGTDQILVLQDLNGDGDANDLGEAYDYCTIPGGAGAVGNSIPTKVIVGGDLNVYYTDVASTGAVVKGVYRLVDLNGSGTCNGPGEVTLFWAPPFSSSPFYWSLATDAAQNFYVSDHSANENIWRARDVNADGAIDPATEQTLFFHTSGSTWWDLVVRDDGWILAFDAQSPDHITALKDLNGDEDALDPGESYEAYNQTTAGTLMNLRGAAFQRAPTQTLSLATVPIGGSTNVGVLTSKPGDLALIVLSLGVIPPVSIPPLGYVRVDPNFAPLFLGLADANSQVSYTLNVPNVPTAINSYGIQSLAGDFFRLYLTNSDLMTCF